MSAEENKRLVCRLVEEAVAGRNVDVQDLIAAGEFVEIAKRWVVPFQSAFPDFEMQIVDLIAEGEKVVAQSNARAPIAVIGSACPRREGGLRTSTRSTSSACKTGDSCPRSGSTTIFPGFASSASLPRRRDAHRARAERLWVGRPRCA